MSPPELTGNTPVTDILQPVIICLIKMRWYKLGISILYCLNGRLCQIIHLNKPLKRYSWLYCCMTTVAGSYIMLMILDL